MGINVVGATSNLVSTAATLGNNFGALASLGVPAPNILSNYASYTYTIALHPLKFTELNFPDTSYLQQGKVLPIICKSANADPNNRVRTPNFGQQDFFINNLTFDTYIGHGGPKTTSVATVQFDVYEPYSIGLFINACQTAAIEAGYSNWRDAPFLISVEFRGNTENGTLKKVPFSTRYIPIRLSYIDMKASDQGTRYLINAYATQGIALTTEFATLRSDTSIKGTTVQEVLQTGEQSLQAVINNKLQEAVKNKTQKVADQVVIIFPQADAASKQVSRAAGSTTTGPNKAYVNPQRSEAADAVFKKLGVNPATLEQASGQVNEIGSASLGFDPSRIGSPPPGNQQDTWDPTLGIWLRGKLVPNYSENEFKFTQSLDIPTVINQIILSSKYAETAFASKDNNGMITWWRVDTQTYYVDPRANELETSTAPKINVYRVVPYKVHMSKVAGAGTAEVGFDQLKAACVKRYDYIFTGKNTEVLKFNIDYNVGFANSYASDAFLNSMGLARPGQTSVGDNQEQKTTFKSAPAGAAFQPNVDGYGGANRAQYNNAAVSNSLQGTGGSDGDTALQMLGKSFHDAITNPYDMVMLDLEILGDPYWFATSGMGNYIAEPVPNYKDLNKDGSVNWQTSQVDVIVNFRTPVDLNQTTGLYNFKGPNHMDMTKDPKNGPAIGFTGLYCVNVVTNYFRDGQFRQVLKGFRRNGQEYKKIAKNENVLSSKNPGPVQPGKQ